MSPARTALVCAAALAAAGGCSHEGSYELTWSFAVPPLPPATQPSLDGGSDGATDDGGVPDAPAGDPAIQNAAGACGAHGVFAIRVTGVSGDGTGEDVVAPCTPGRLSRRVASGTWNLTVHALDAQGQFKETQGGVAAGAMLNPTLDGVAIAEGASVALAVVFVPQPQCRDGVDNDGDGRVDLDDPDCAGDPGGARECGPVGGMPCRAP